MCRKDIIFAQNFENCAMNDIPSFNSYIVKTIKENWLLDALTDYKGATLQYHDVARKIEKLHIMMAAAGIEKGDRIAVCGRNSAHWAVAYLATLTYGAVVVPILHEFNAEQIHNIVNHSESKLLFVGDYVVNIIDPNEMPNLEGILNLVSILTNCLERNTLWRSVPSISTGMLTNQTSYACSIIRVALLDTLKESCSPIVLCGVMWISVSNSWDRKCLNSVVC